VDVRRSVRNGAEIEGNLGDYRPKLPSKLDDSAVVVIIYIGNDAYLYNFAQFEKKSRGARRENAKYRFASAGSKKCWAQYQ
jgi:hypothetical protein